MTDRRVTRTKMVHLEPLGEERYRLTASLKDVSFGGNHASSETGLALHDLHLTAVAATPQLLIESIDVAAATMPYRSCPFVLPTAQDLVGRSLLGGWRKAVLEASGSTRGCTHVNTLLLGLSEMQALVGFLRVNDVMTYSPETLTDGSWLGVALPTTPAMTDACYSLREDGPMVQRGRTFAQKTEKDLSED